MTERMKTKRGGRSARRTEEDWGREGAAGLDCVIGRLDPWKMPLSRRDGEIEIGS